MRHFTKNKVLLVFLTYSAMLRAQSLKLETCYEFSGKNYPLIKQYDLINRSLEFTIRNANKAYFPQVSVNGIAAYVFGGLPSFSLPGAAPADENNFHLIGIAQLNQVLWDGGATKAHKEMLQASSEIERSQVEVNLHLLRERVNQIFFGILLIDEQVKQLKLQKELLGTNVKRLEALKDNGLVYLTDVDELKAEVLRVEQREIEFRYARQAYTAMLSYMINQELDENTVLEIPAEKTLATGEIVRPERTLFANQKKALAAQSAADKVGLMPKLGMLGAGVALSPGISFGPGEFSSIAIGGLSLSWNTGGLYRNANNKEIQKINLQKIEVQEEQFLFNTKLQLKQVHADVSKKSAIISKDEEIVQVRTTIRVNYQKKYDRGLCTLLDVITATEKETEAKANKALHNIEWLLSSYQYNTSNGN